MNFKMWRFWKKSKRKVNKPRLDSFNVPEKVFTPIDELKLGMYVCELDRPWLETPFILQGLTIKTEADLKAIRDICDYVYIDMTKQILSKKTVTRAHAGRKNHIYSNKPAPAKLGSFEQEIERAETVYTETSLLVKEFMDNVADGGGIDAKSAKLAVAECVNSVLHSPDAVLWLSQLKNKDEYTAQHSMNVCVLSIVLGRHANLTDHELNEVGLCGMMHDMGKMLVPLNILNKPGILEAEELGIMRSHTNLGYELLQSSPGIFDGAIDVAYAHHERLDGKGYPRKIRNDKISSYTRMVAIADTYDAITSDRVYKKGKTHLEATNIMSNDGGKHLDPDLVIKFIESLGVYPPGCLVKLNNNAIAIVVEVNREKRLRPKIMILLDEEKNLIPEKVLDLSDNGHPYTITGIVRAEDYAIDSKRYYQQGIIEKGFAAVK